MKQLTILTLALIVSVNVFGQTNPRKVTIKKSVTISKDSTYYLPDTIACVFQELVIKPDTVYTKWHKGFVVWQVWNAADWGITGATTYTGSWNIGTLTTITEPKPYKTDYRFSDTMPGIFLYSDKTKVTNKVIQSY